MILFSCRFSIGEYLNIIYCKNMLLIGMHYFPYASPDGCGFLMRHLVFYLCLFRYAISTQEVQFQEEQTNYIC